LVVAPRSTEDSPKSNELVQPSGSFDSAYGNEI
jgi:hypothetical protein